VSLVVSVCGDDFDNDIFVFKVPLDIIWFRLLCSRGYLYDAFLRNFPTALSVPIYDNIVLTVSDDCIWTV
jgi:hypothetical protein